MKYLLFSIAITLLCGCQNEAGKEYAELSDSVSITGVTGDSVKLIKTASLHLKVQNVEKGITQISAVARRYGGMLTHQNMESVTNDVKELAVSDDSLLQIIAYTPEADIVARVPVQHLDTFMQQMADVGYFTNNSRLDIEDKSLAYLENSLKTESRIAIASDDRLGKPMPAKDLIRIRDEAIGQQIENMQIDGDVHYSLVSLHLYQNALVKKEMMANYVLAHYELPFTQRIKTAFAKGIDHFLSLLVTVAELWLIIITAVVIVVVYKAWSNKRRESIVG